MKKFVRAASSAAVFVIIPGALMTAESVAHAQVSDSSATQSARWVLQNFSRTSLTAQ